MNKRDTVGTHICKVLTIILPESFLSSCVPNLQFDCFIDHADNLGTKFYSNGVVGIIINCKKENIERYNFECNMMMDSDDLQSN